jgi:hypothetical protein
VWVIVGLGAERWSQRTKDLAAIMNRTSDTGTAWVRRCIERRLSKPDFAHTYLVWKPLLRTGESPTGPLEQLSTAFRPGDPSAN